MFCLIFINKIGNIYLAEVSDLSKKQEQ